MSQTSGKFLDVAFAQKVNVWKNFLLYMDKLLQNLLF